MCCRDPPGVEFQVKRRRFWRSTVASMRSILPTRASRRGTYSSAAAERAAASLASLPNVHSARRLLRDAGEGRERGSASGRALGTRAPSIDFRGQQRDDARAPGQRAEVRQREGLVARNLILEHEGLRPEVARELEERQHVERGSCGRADRFMETSVVVIRHLYRRSLAAPSTGKRRTSNIVRVQRCTARGATMGERHVVLRHLDVTQPHPFLRLMERWGWRGRRRVGPRAASSASRLGSAAHCPRTRTRPSVATPAPPAPARAGPARPSSPPRDARRALVGPRPPGAPGPSRGHRPRPGVGGPRPRLVPDPHHPPRPAARSRTPRTSFARWLPPPDPPPPLDVPRAPRHRRRRGHRPLRPPRRRPSSPRREESSRVGVTRHTQRRTHIARRRTFTPTPAVPFTSSFSFSATASIRRG